MNIILSYHIAFIYEIRIKVTEWNAKTLFLTMIRSVFFCTPIMGRTLRSLCIYQCQWLLRTQERFYFIE